MPPKSSLTTTFSASDTNEVVCPLMNQDGTNCRKRCIGEKRYRSMQEHIRRAHPEHYMPKLPANERSFQLMVETPPSERPQPPPPPPPPPPPIPPPPAPTRPIENSAYGHDRDTTAYTTAKNNSPAPARILDDPHPAAATAAVALAQLHNHKPDSDWDSEAEYGSDKETGHVRMRSSVELPPIRNHVAHELVPPFQSPRPRELLPSVIDRSPTGRSSTLPPIQRRDPKPARPRKSSITQNSRKPKHERTKSKDHVRRMSIEGRKAFSAEPQGPASKRWEELIEAATSAESDRDMTPVSASSMHHTLAPLKYPLSSAQVPQSPASSKRTSLPPFSTSHLSHYDPYKSSPLQHALTPPSPPTHYPSHEPFPSVESVESTSAGHTFHMPPSGLSSDAGTSPTFPLPVQIYCAFCKRSSVAKDSYVCMDCIGGFCSECVYRLTSDPHQRRPCPRCGETNVQFKAIQLDFR